MIASPTTLNNSHLNNAIGIASAYTGEYTCVDSTKMTGASLSELVGAQGQGAMTAKLNKTLNAMHTIKAHPACRGLRSDDRRRKHRSSGGYRRSH